MNKINAAADFLDFIGTSKFSTILADPPWQFENRTGKMAPEHKRLARYQTLTLQQIKEIPVVMAAEERAHLYLWVPNALLAEGLEVMRAWGFNYKTNLVWYKIRKDGGPDRRGVGFYFRNVTEILLFGVRGKNVRTLKQGRTQPNIISKQKREHSRKPDEQYEIIESCSWGPYLEMFARGNRTNWFCWGNQAQDYYPEWKTYRNHSQLNSAKAVIANGDQSRILKLFNESKTKYKRSKHV